MATLALTMNACNSPDPLRSMEMVATSLVGARDVVQQSPERLRALQVRDFAGLREVAFAAAMSTLLDLGYQVQSADLATGFIVAKAPTTGRLKLDIKGLGTSNQTPVAAVYVEQRTAQTVRVRISLTVETTSSAITSVAGRTISDAAPYNAFHSSLALDLSERRTAAAASNPAATRARQAEPAISILPAMVE